MSDTITVLSALLLKLYDQDKAKELADALRRRIEDFNSQHPEFLSNVPAKGQLTESDIVLIVYGDQFREPERPPLQTLRAFLQNHLQDVINYVHILPFFSSSSDDGFSVRDYRQVSAELGSWQDIARLGENQRLIFDLVLNHVSAQSAWFEGFLNGEPEYCEFFHVLDADIDLSQVVRPRSSPLLTPFQTVNGVSHVWTTFSADQIDLNYNNPRVLLEMIDILLMVVARGAQIIRLDAIAYLWKIPGTSCIHLPQTHSVIKVLRAVLDATAPSVLLLTETNVPHQENIRYFGDYLPEKQRSDEAQMVYQFPLAPLILHTFLTGDATRLTRWAEELPNLPRGLAFLNFTASHDGIGIRPVEGMLAPQEIRALVENTRSHGGMISYRSNRDGDPIAYELNISWYDALNDPANPDPEMDIRRFLASQAIMLELAGVPGIYVHSLLGSRNCSKCVNEIGRPRSINREKFLLADLQKELDNPHCLKSRVLAENRRLLQIRITQPAFHPAAQQDILHVDSAIFVIVRTAQDGTRLICLTNVTPRIFQTEIGPSDWDLPGNKAWIDLLSGETFPALQKIQIALGPYQSRWLKAPYRISNIA